MRRARLLLAAFISLSVLVGGVDVVTAPPAVAAPKPVDERPEAERARDKAKATGKRVEIVERRTDRSLTFANPDGTTTDEIASSPVRVRRGGLWRDLDLSLTQRGNRWGPAVSPADVSFSAGGRDRDLIHFRAGQRRVRISWPTTLPAATVSGGVATYRGVAPDTDLELATTASGYEKYLRLGKAPAVPEYRFDYRLTGVELQKDEAGTLVLVDRRDRVVARVPAPRMWDASVDPSSGEPRRSADVATEVRQVPGGAQLVLRPDADWLTDPATQYPVTIDPGATLGGTADTWVQEGYSSSQYSNAQLRIGTYDGATVARSMLRFDVAPYAGTHVTAATLRLYNVWSYQCTAAAVNAYPLTTGFGPSTVWAGQPGSNTSATWAGSGSFSFGHTNCADGWGTVNVQKMVDGWTRGGLPNYGMAVRASETATSGWKKFCSGNPSTAADMAPCSSTSLTPRLAITYNTFATAPGALSAAPCTYLCSAPAVANPSNLIPTLTAQSSDRDGTSLRYDFEI